MKRNIISLQSQVASGYVGNNIAGLAIQLHGLDPVFIPSVILSNHVEYPEVYGMAMTPNLITDLFKGIKVNGIIEQSNFIISGFCYDLQIISALSEFIIETKEKYRYIYTYDPAFGDYRAGGLYVDEKIASHSVSVLLPLSDIITPNHFELEYILKKKVCTEADLFNYINEHILLQSKTVIVTSAELDDTPKGTIEVVLIKDGVLKRYAAPRVSLEMIGAGDLFTAVLISQMNLVRDIDKAIKRAMVYLGAVLTYAKERSHKDLNAENMTRHVHLLFD